MRREIFWIKESISHFRLEVAEETSCKTSSSCHFKPALISSGEHTQRKKNPVG